MLGIVRLCVSAALLTALIVLIWAHDSLGAREAGMEAKGTSPDSSRKVIIDNQDKAKTSTSNSRAGFIEDAIRTNEDQDEDKLVSVIVKLKKDTTGAGGGGAPGSSRHDSDLGSEGKREGGGNDGTTHASDLDKRFMAFESAVLESIPEARINYLFRSETGHVHIYVPVSRLNDLAKLPGVDAVYSDECCLYY